MSEFMLGKPAFVLSVSLLFAACGGAGGESVTDSFDISEVDCLSTTNEEGTQFCYQQPNRTLSAHREDGSLWWSFDLPGIDSENRVERLLASDEFLLVVAEINDAGERAFEISSFEFTGEFVETTPAISLPTVDTTGVVEILGFDSFVLLVADCTVEGELGTVVKLKQFRRYIPPGGLDNTTLDPFVFPLYSKKFTDCMVGQVRSGLSQIAEPGELTLELNGQSAVFDVYTTQPKIEFVEKTYSIQTRVATRDLLLSVLSDLEFFYPSLGPRVDQKIRSLRPEDGQPFTLECSDGGQRFWENGQNFNEQYEVLSHANCRTGGFLIEEGFSRFDIGVFNEGQNQNTAQRFAHQYEATDMASEERWTISTERFKESAGDGDELNTGYVHYRNREWRIEIERTKHTVIDNQHSWVGSFTRENFITGVIEFVDIDINSYIDDTNQVQMNGFIDAMQTGGITQSFRVELLPESTGLARYTVTVNGETDSVTELW